MYITRYKWSQFLWFYCHRLKSHHQHIIWQHICDVHVYVTFQTFAYLSFFSEPSTRFCTHVLREYFMCSYAVVRRCFVSAAQETVLHELQSECRRRTGGLHPASLLRTSKRSESSTGTEPINPDQDSSSSPCEKWSVLQVFMHPPFDFECLLWYVHTCSKHRLCEDVAKQPKNNLKGIKGRLRGQNSLAMQSQRKDGSVFITTEED